MFALKSNHRNTGDGFGILDNVLISWAITWHRAIILLTASSQIISTNVTLDRLSISLSSGVTHTVPVMLMQKTTLLWVILDPIKNVCWEVLFWCFPEPLLQWLVRPRARLPNLIISGQNDIRNDDECWLWWASLGIPQYSRQRTVGMFLDLIVPLIQL